MQFHLSSLKPQSINRDEQMAHTHSRYFSALSQWLQLMLPTGQREGLSASQALCSVCQVVAAVGQRWVSPCVPSSACEVPLSAGPLSRSSLVAPPFTAAESESDCPSLDSHWTPLAPVYQTVHRPAGWADPNNLTHRVLACTYIRVHTHKTENA